MQRLRRISFLEVVDDQLLEFIVLVLSARWRYNAIYNPTSVVVPTKERVGIPGPSLGRERFIRR